MQDHSILIQQNHGKFGIIPLVDLILPPAGNKAQTNLSLIEMHKIVKQSDKFHFLQCQLMIKSQLNPDAWEALLKDYLGQEFIQLIKFGFPLDFDTFFPLAEEDPNHNSAVEHPKTIEAYLQGEIKFNCIFWAYFSYCLHYSPVMTRENPGASNKRVVIDLGYHKGQSVNAWVHKGTYLGTPFILTLQTIGTN